MRQAGIVCVSKGLAVVLLLVGGCVNIQAPREINIGDKAYGGRHKSSGPQTVSKSQAYEIAKETASQQGASCRRYDIHDKEIDDTYWVLFEHESKKRTRGWQNHFAVRVSPMGSSRMYSGATGCAVISEGVEKELEKDDAYDLAKRLARQQGVSWRDYKIKDKEIDHVYWVLFEHQSPTQVRGWKRYFCVRVSPTWRAELYKGQ